MLSKHVNKVSKTQKNIMIQANLEEINQNIPNLAHKLKYENYVNDYELNKEKKRN